MNRWIPIVLAGLAAALLIGAPALTKDLWTPDEPRYALVAKEMMLSGDYLVPHRNNELYREKPPLLFWLIAAASWPVGTVTELTTRVPSILSALLTLLLTYDLARRMFGERTGAWSVLILMTLFRFWWQSNTGQIDMLLTACLTLSMYALWRWRGAPQARWAFGFNAGLALGLLAKGPPALLIAGLGMLASGWANGDGRRNLRLWLGVPLALIPVGLWFYLARSAAGSVGDEAAGTFSRQIADRMLSGVNHSNPPWYYLMNLPADWFPWIVFTPWTIVYAWRKRREGPAMRHLLGWALPSLIFFHLIAEKRTLYLLPLYPAAAVITARSILALVDAGRFALMRTSAAIWGITLLAMIALPVALPFSYVPIDANGGLWILSIVGLACLMWTGLLARVGAWRHWPVALGAQAAIAYLAIGLAAYPAVNPLRSSKEFCSPVRALAAAGPVKVYSVVLMREEYVFYSDAFHEVVLLDAGASGLQGGSGVPGADQLRLRMSEACGSIRIASPASPTNEERAALRTAVDQALAAAGLKGDSLEAYRRQVAVDVGGVLEAMKQPIPAVLIVQHMDWGWMQAFAENTQFLAVVRDERVSRRDVLLLANPVAAERLARHGTGVQDK